MRYKQMPHNCLKRLRMRSYIIRVYHGDQDTRIGNPLRIPAVAAHDALYDVEEALGGGF